MKDKQSTDESASESLISQEEFSVLLDRSGAEGKRPTANFGDADRIVRGQLQNLDLVNERFARMFKTSLFDLLMQEIEVLVDPHKAVRFSDYKASLPVPTSLNVVTIPQLSCQGLLMVEGSLVASLTDVFYGGTGRVAHHRAEEEFTPTERRLAESVLDHMLTGLGDAWAPVLALSWEKKKTESNPHFVSICAPSEKVMVCSFTLEGGDCQGQVQVVLPMAALASIRGVLTSAVNSDRESHQAMWRKSIESGLHEADLPVRAVLCETEITLAELISLKAGDVLAIELPGLSTVIVGDTPVYRGQFGIHNGFNAVRLVNQVRENSDGKPVGNTPPK